MDQGWLWIIIDVVAVVILGAALIFGIMHYRRRPVTTEHTDEAVHNIYNNDTRGQI